MHLKDLLSDASRCSGLTAEHDGIYLDYSRENVTSQTMDGLLELAEVSKLKDKMNAMKSGQHINQTEDRAVLHIALRCPKTETCIVDGVNMVPEVHSVLDKIAIFSEKVRQGEWIG